MRILLILLFGLTIISCNQAPVVQDKAVTVDATFQKEFTKDSMPDTLPELFTKALTSESVKFSNQFSFEAYKSFLFFKSGNLISKTEKNAIVVNCPTDTTYMVRLYSVQSGKWQLIDSISDLDAFPTQFDLKINDYNFDDQNDIYIQASASMGWSLSKGHLIIMDPMTKKFELHKEARKFGNMTIDKKTKSIKSEMRNGINTIGPVQLIIFTNKWINGKLKTTSEEYVTVNDE